MRIKTISKMTKGANTLLDIGTDHGLVVIESLKSGYVKKAIATDINEGPLKRAIINIKKENLENKVKFIQTEGFKNITLTYDCVVITGMGYQTIRDILLEPHLTPKFYIFGPQTEIVNFRRFLNENKYKIIDEQIVYEKKYYIFIKAIKAKQTLKEEDIILGPILKTNKKALPYYEYRAKKIEEKMSFSVNEDLIYFNKVLKILKTVINRLK